MVVRYIEDSSLFSLIHPIRNVYHTFAYCAGSGLKICKRLCQGLRYVCIVQCVVRHVMLHVKSVSYTPHYYNEFLYAHKHPRNWCIPSHVH